MLARHGYRVALHYHRHREQAEGVAARINQEGAGAGRATGVTLLVDESQAADLAFATAHGTVSLALVPPEDARGSALGVSPRR
jgi:Flp pilus assembly protein CpaB